MKNDISVEDAGAVLDALSCSGDPLWYRCPTGTRTEYTVYDLIYEPAFFGPDGTPKRANRLQIVFYGQRANKSYGYFSGTLADMILERLGCPHRARALPRLPAWAGRQGRSEDDG